MSGHGPGEFESEPVRGLPEALPPGEHILWQGSPSRSGLSRRAFHTRKLAVYFAILLALRVGFAVADGKALEATVVSTAGLAGLAAACLGLLELFAWLNGRCSVYTITNRRVVLRIGVAFVVALNLPFESVRSAGLRVHADGTGDIPLDMSGTKQLGYLLLWPHARPWRFGEEAQPMLRAVPDVESVAAILGAAIASASLERPPVGVQPRKTREERAPQVAAHAIARAAS